MVTKMRFYFGILLYLLVVYFENRKGVTEAVGHYTHHHFDWSYNISALDGPNHWKIHFPHCNLIHIHEHAVPHVVRQSPININSSKTVYGYDFRIWWTYANPILRGKITESHRAPVFQVEYGLSAGTAGTRHKRHVIGTASHPEGTTYYLMGVPGYNGRAFNLHQFHFHFRDTGKPGSEHAIDMKKFDAEVHFVHYNSKYRSFKEAVDQPDGLLVVAIFLQVGKKVDPIMDKILEKFHRLQNHFDYKAEIPTIDVFKPDQTHFYIYEGSTTAPSCHEHVLWLVKRDPITIAQRQLDILRKLRCKEYNNGERIALAGNVRPLQTHYEPTVYANFKYSDVIRRNPGARPHNGSEVHNHGPELKLGKWHKHITGKEPGINLGKGKEIGIGSQRGKVDTPVLVKSLQTSIPVNKSMGQVPEKVLKTDAKQDISVVKGMVQSADKGSDTSKVQTTNKGTDVNKGVGIGQGTNQIEALKDLLKLFVGRLEAIGSIPNENSASGKLKNTGSGFVQQQGKAKHIIIVQSQNIGTAETKNTTKKQTQQSGSGQSKNITGSVVPFVAGESNTGKPTGEGQTQQAGNGQGKTLTGDGKPIVTGEANVVKQAAAGKSKANEQLGGEGQANNQQSATEQAKTASGKVEPTVAGEPEAKQSAAPGGEQVVLEQPQPAEQAQEGPSPLETRVLNAIEMGKAPNISKADINTIRTKHHGLMEDLAELMPATFPEI